MDDERVRITFRIPVDIRDQIVASARQTRRSMNEEMIVWLEERQGVRAGSATTASHVSPQPAA